MAVFDLNVVYKRTKKEINDTHLGIDGFSGRLEGGGGLGRDGMFGLLDAGGGAGLDEGAGRL